MLLLTVYTILLLTVYATTLLLTVYTTTLLRATKNYKIIELISQTATQRWHSPHTIFYRRAFYIIKFHFQPISNSGQVSLCFRLFFSWTVVTVFQLSSRVSKNKTNRTVLKFQTHNNEQLYFHIDNFILEIVYPWKRHNVRQLLDN